MKCPACGTKFRSLSSWPLASGKPVVCDECGTASRRQGKWIPLLIAAAALFLFQQILSLYPFTFVGTVLVLGVLALVSMIVDEATVVLEPVPGPSANGDGNA